MKVITAQEALDGYAGYAVMDVLKNKTYGLYPDVDMAQRIANDLCKRYGDGSYVAAVIV